MTNPTEAQTRRELIDPALERAGWDLNNPDQVGFEIPVDDVDPDTGQVGADGVRPSTPTPATM